jgi:hypothetical protein
MVKFRVTETLPRCQDEPLNEFAARTLGVCPDLAEMRTGISRFPKPSKIAQIRTHGMPSHVSVRTGDPSDASVRPRSDSYPLRRELRHCMRDRITCSGEAGHLVTRNREFLKTEGFSVPAHRAGACLGFSAQAVSLILGKEASRSLNIFAVLMIPMRPASATTDRADIRRRSRSRAAGARSATRPRRTAGYSRSWPVRH